MVYNQKGESNFENAKKMCHISKYYLIFINSIFLDHIDFEEKFMKKERKNLNKDFFISPVLLGGLV